MTGNPFAFMNRHNHDILSDDHLLETYRNHCHFINMSMSWESLLDHCESIHIHDSYNIVSYL